jgi:hypothetical protein
MSRKMIPVEEFFAAWRTDPEYERPTTPLRRSSRWWRAMIETRARAGLTQE